MERNVKLLSLLSGAVFGPTLFIIALLVIGTRSGIISFSPAPTKADEAQFQPAAPVFTNSIQRDFYYIETPQTPVSAADKKRIHEIVRNAFGISGEVAPPKKFDIGKIQRKGNIAIISVYYHYSSIAAGVAVVLVEFDGGNWQFVKKEHTWIS